MADVTGQFGQEEIVLNNAATEATLKSILASMQVVAAKSMKDFKSQDELEKELGRLAKTTKTQVRNGKKIDTTQRSYLNATEDQTEAIKEGVKAYDQQVKSLQEFKADVEKAASSITGLISAVGSAAATVRTMDGSIGGAVEALGQIPMGVGDVIKGIFGPVAGAVDATHNAFLEASSVGANFGGNMRDLLQSSGQAGLSLQEFTGIVKNNSEALMFLGGDTANGAKRLAQLGKEIRKTPLAADLARLGYSTEDINEGFASYAKMTARAGRLEGMTNAQLVAQTGAYLKNLDAVSKLTGKSKEALQAEQDARMADAQFQQMKRKLDADGQIAFEALMQTIPKELQAGAKEVLSTGTATTDAGVQFMAFMKKSGMSAQELFQTMNQTGTLTKDQVVGFSKTMQDEAKSIADSSTITTMAKFDPAMNDMIIGIYANAGRTKDLGQVYNEIEANLKNIRDGNVPNIIDPDTVQNFKQNVNQKATEMTEALASVDLTKLEEVFNKAADMAIEYLPKAVNLAAENFELVAGTVLALNGAALLAAGALKMLSLSAGGSLMGNRGLTDKGKAAASGKGPGGKASVAKGAAKGILRRFAPIAALMSAYEGYTGYQDAQAQVDAGEITSSQGTVAKSEAVGGAVGSGGGALAGAAAGAAIGSVVPIVGTAIGGLIGGAVGWWAGSKAGSAIGETIGETIAGPDTIKDVEARIAELNKAIEEDSFSSVGFSSKDEKKELEQLQKDLELLKKRKAEEEAKLKEAEGSPADPNKPADADPNSASSGSTSSESNTTATDAQKSLEQQKAEAEKKAAEEAKKKEEEAKKKQEQASGNLTSAVETKKSPEEVMLALNNNIEELVNLTRMSNALSQKHIGVSQGLTNDAFTV